VKNEKPILLIVLLATLLIFAPRMRAISLAADQPAATAQSAEVGSPQAPATAPEMMGGKGRMSGGMMGPGMMGMGMMGAGPCMMMNSDPKTRGQMMQIQGRMMKEMGELMEKRGKEIELGK